MVTIIHLSEALNPKVGPGVVVVIVVGWLEMKIILCMNYDGPFRVDAKYFGGREFPLAELWLSWNLENIICFLGP